MAQRQRFGMGRLGTALGFGLLLAAPWQASAQEKPATPEAAVEQFMKAVADSNLDRMMQLWGTERGSAASTNQPSDRGKRIYIMYAFLKGGTTRIATSAPSPESDKQRSLIVDFRRGDCNKLVPFTAVKTKNEGWIVNAIDLSVVGVPGRSCSDGPPPPDSTKGSN